MAPHPDYGNPPFTIPVTIRMVRREPGAPRNGTKLVPSVSGYGPVGASPRPRVPDAGTDGSAPSRHDVLVCGGNQRPPRVVPAVFRG